MCAAGDAGRSAVARFDLELNGLAAPASTECLSIFGCVFDSLRVTRPLGPRVATCRVLSDESYVEASVGWWVEWSKIEKS